MRKILLNVELTTICKAACSMCPREAVPKNKLLSEHLFDEIMNNIDPNMIWEIDFSGRGEPLLHPLFCYFIKKAANHGITTAVVTTSNNYNQDIEFHLSNYTDIIRLSVSSYNIKTFKKVHCGLNFKDTWANIEKIAEHNAHKTIIHLTGGEIIYDDLEYTVDKLKDLGFKSFRLFPLWNRAGNNDEISNEKNRRKYIMEKLNILPSESEYDGGDKKSFIEDYKVNIIQNPHYCMVGDSSLFITSEGNVLGCFQDFSEKCVVGNIQNDTIRNILIKRKVNIGNYKICYKCNSNIAMLNLK